MPIKIVIYFAVHRRLEALKVCLAGIERLKRYAPERFQIDTFAVCSAKDESKVLRKAGVKHIIFPNDPLGAKKNAGLRRALEFEWDYLMELGSDDLLTSDILDLYEPLMQEGKMAFGINSCWFYQVASGKVAYFKNDYAIGAGRCFKRSLFDKLGDNLVVRYKASFVTPFGNHGRNVIAVVPRFFANTIIRAGLAEMLYDQRQPLEFWTPQRQRSLDGDSMVRLNSQGIAVDYIDIERPYCLDIKTGININGFERFDTVEYDILNHFPNERDAIRRLRQENHAGELQHIA